jgi:hypothetical protein
VGLIDHNTKGFEEDQIAHMTPEKPHQLLDLLPPLIFTASQIIGLE